MSKIFGGGSRSGSSSVAFPAELRELVAKQTELADLGLESLKELQGLIPEDFERSEKELELFRKASEKVIETLGDPSEALAEITKAELENALNAGTLTAEDEALINETFDFAVESLEKDTARAFQSQLKDIQSQFTKRGLRVDTDSPVGDRAAAAISDTQNIFQGRVAQLRSTQAREKLNRPLQAASAKAGILASARGGAADLTNLKLGLQEGNLTKTNQLLLQRQGALQNLGAISTQGIPVAISGLARAFNQSSSSSSSPGILGTLGKLAGGFGAILSHPSYRENILDPEPVLDKIRQLDIKNWNYIGEDIQHIGPLADQWHELFNLGDGTTISVIDAIGILIKGIQELQNDISTRQ